MVHQCKVKSCRALGSKGFYGFPKNSIAVIDEWKKVCEVTEIKSSFKVCFRHFHRDELVRKGNIFIPKTNAIPKTDVVTTELPSILDSIEVQMGEMTIDMDQVKSQLESLGNSVNEILNILKNTPSPVTFSTPAPTIRCTDRKGKWKLAIGNKNGRNWCGWARKQANTHSACLQKNLSNDCPATCGKDGCIN